MAHHTCLSLLAVVAGTLAAGPATSPTTNPSVPDILADMKAAKNDLAAAVGADPKAMGDAARRAAIAPRAVPAVKRLMADVVAYDAATGRPAEQDVAFLIQLRAIGSALGDADSTDTLSRMARDAQPVVSVRGQLGQVLADWLRVPADAAGQSKVADQMAVLDAGHPDSNEAAYFTTVMAGGAASPAVRSQLVGSLSKMTAPAAVTLRQRIAPPTTRP